MSSFLPTTAAEAAARGWDRCDFVVVTGDAYVDHPSFAAALISRVLEAEGFRVGVLPQPRCEEAGSMLALGEPRLAYLVSAGNMDSMVNRYTANRKPRSGDAYSPGGKAGLRPDRALLRYVNAIRRDCKGARVVIGGIEASLRRLSHYDYWSDKARRSILIDSKADLLVYGMGERTLRALARRLAAGEDIKDIRDLRGTVYKIPEPPTGEVALAREGDVPASATVLELPGFEAVDKDKRAFARAFMDQHRNADPFRGAVLVERQSLASEAPVFAVQNPPAAPLSPSELDAVYELPYARDAHPMYAAAGGVPALEEVRFSLASSRGCFGSCSFCALAFHQGRIVQARSAESLLREARLLTALPGFKGIIHDVGGPTANFRRPACKQQLVRGACEGRTCLAPEPCPELEVDHSEYLALLRRIRELPGVKRVFVRSGVRFDYLMLDPDPKVIEEFAEHYVSGQLKVAPEHVSERVLKLMGKPPREAYERFAAAFSRANATLGKKQYLVPYYIASHPGSTVEDAIELAVHLKEAGFVPDQVQDFYPTPGTLSSCMYHTGLDPRTMREVHVPRGERERATQRALLQFDKPGNRALVAEALKQAGREDLIGGKRGLVPEGGGRDSGPRRGGPRGRAAPRNGAPRGPAGRAGPKEDRPPKEDCPPKKDRPPREGRRPTESRGPKDNRDPKGRRPRG